jgi:hypothetical protein
MQATDNIVGTAGTGSSTRRAARRNCQVIKKEVPFLVESLTEADKDKLLEILRTISGSEGETLGQELAHRCHHRHLHRSLLLIVALVETFLKVSHCELLGSCHRALELI